MDAFFEKREYDSNVRIWCCCYRNIRFLPHYHREIEMIYLREGATHIGINNCNYQCQKGDLVICRSGSVHYCNSLSEDSVLDFLVFDPEILNDVYTNNRALPPVITAGQLKQYNLQQNCREMFSTVHTELTSQETDYNIITALIIMSFWLYCNRYFGKTQYLEEQLPFHVAMAKAEKLMQYIDEHYTEPIDLSDAAEIMGYEVSYCSKVFKHLTGVNFTQYLSNVKIGKAIEKLRKSQMSITDIAMECGFNNIRTFNRTFKSVTNMTPSEFIRVNRTMKKANRAHPPSHMTSTVLSFDDSWN